MPERCCTVLSAERSAVSMSARLAPRCASGRRPRATRVAILAPAARSATSGSSARKKASAMGRPATVIASRLSITPANTRIGRDDGGGGDVARLAQILGQRRGDEGGDIEGLPRSRSRRHHRQAEIAEADRARCHGEHPVERLLGGEARSPRRARCAAPCRAAPRRASPACSGPCTGTCCSCSCRLRPAR